VNAVVKATVLHVVAMLCDLVATRGEPHPPAAFIALSNESDLLRA
jgi:hypothetical protein